MMMRGMLLLGGVGGEKGRRETSMGVCRFVTLTCIIAVFSCLLLVFYLPFTC